MSQIRTNYILAFTIVGCLVGLPITGQTKETVKEQLEALNQRLEGNLLQSNQHLENSEYHQAEVLTSHVLADLDLLLEATMPLDERINQLIETEEIIINETKKIDADKSNNTDQSVSDNAVDELIFDQVKNREKTLATAALTKKQLELSQKQAAQGSSQQTNNPVNAQKNLQDVVVLLENASDSQTAAIDDLEEKRFKPAAQKEGEALESLKKALEKLRQNSKSQSQAQNNQQSGQQKKDQKQTANQQKQAQDQAAQNNGSKEKTKASDQKKKMDAEEALKQLAKLRKKAREEQERRRRQFGVQELGGQSPVEKDW